MKRYLKYVKPYKLYFILAPIFMMAQVAADVFLPSLVADIVNIADQGGDTHKIFMKVMMMVALSCLSMAGTMFGVIFAVKATVNFSADLRLDVFKKVQTFSFATIDRITTASLITRLTNDITQMQRVTEQFLRIGLRTPALMIGSFVMAFKMNIKLAMIVFVIMPVIAVTVVTIMKKSHPKFRFMQTKIDGLNTRVQEAMTNVRVIKTFVRDEFEKEKFEEANEQLKDASVDASKLMLLQRPIMTIAMNFTNLAVIWFAGKLIMGNVMPIGNLTAFTTYIAQILSSLTMFAMVLMRTSRAVASANRVTEVLTTEENLNDNAARFKDLKVTRGEIEFKNVSYRYYKTSPAKVLDDISFKINAGEVVGIVGATGSGKTTLVQMIPRLQDADEGEVLVDGIDVRDYSLQNLRNQVAMVLQNNLLFSGTVEENLKWGDEDASEEAMIEMASAAQAHDFVMSFTDKYESEIGQGGVNVSGGQKQRLCIARALLKHPQILILDDSTSAVDTATEARIRKCFDEQMKGATKIIIAQRITSVIDADRILVIDEGRLVGNGTHEELMDSCETYREIYYSQVSREVSA